MARENENEFDRLVRILERGAITTNEFFNNMREALGRFPTSEKLAILDALANRSSEQMRAEVGQVQAYLRNQELSRDFEHVRRNSPLQPGIRLEVFHEYAPKYNPPWLSGRECCRATFVRFERLGENLTPIAFVEFDEAIDIRGTPGNNPAPGNNPGHQGRYGVLFARYGIDHPAWAPREGSVGLCVVGALPNDLEDFCDSHPFTDPHACYRVQDMQDKLDGAKKMST